jgi:hypothetical protein
MCSELSSRQRRKPVKRTFGWLTFPVSLVIFCFCAPILHAQSKAATVVGTITDSSGAVVVGAAVTIKNTATGETATATTGGSGDYVIVNLLYGAYEVTAQKAGFKSSVRTGLSLEIGQETKVDFMLQPGAPNETVQVTGEAPLLETQTSDSSQVINSKQVVDMPLVDRRWLELAALAPGAVAPRNTTGPGFQVGSAIAVNGNGAAFNSFTLDGIENNSPIVNSQGIDPTIDAIQEFRLEDSSESAEYGRAAVNIAVATKSGTNQFHGSAYEFLRNDVLDAKNFFDSPTSKRPQLVQNTFGGTIGGPIVRNRAFFFFSYDALRIRQGNTSFALIPSQSWMQGNFSDVTTQLTDGHGNPLPGNIVPPADINPTATALLSLYPQQNCTSFCPAGFNYFFSSGHPTNRHQWNARTDILLTEKNQLFVRVSEAPLDTFAPGAFAIPIGSRDVQQTNFNIGTGFTHMFSPNKTNTLRAGYNYVRYGQVPQGTGETLGGKAAPPPVPESNPRYQIIGFSLAGFNGINFTRYSKLTDHVYQLADTFTWVTGRHTIKFGGDIRRWQDNLRTGNPYTLGFDGRFTGNPVADMLFGYAATGFSAGRDHHINTRRWDQSYFGQDDWRVTNSLTLNLGLRWDYLGPASDAHDNMSNFDFKTGQIIFVGTPGYPTGGHNVTFRDLNNFGPRVGLAWSPASVPHTVFRMGYGIFYMYWQGQGDLGIGPASKSDPIVNFNGNTSDPSGLGFDNLYPIGNIAAGGLPYALAKSFHIRTPYIQQWNFTVQHQLGQSTSIQAAYIGNKGNKIWEIDPFNTPLPGSSPIQSRVPYPNVGYSELETDIGSSSYHALQTKVEKRYSAGVTLLGSYTWSRSTDTNSDMIYRVFNPYNLSQDRGLSDFDVRHRFVASWIFELPAGKGKRFLNSANGFVDNVLGGWSIGGITLFESGMPFTVDALGDPANIGLGTRPNVVGDWRLSNPSIHEWFNTAAFANPAPFTIGNERRNMLTGPGINRWDLNLSKTFHITERHQIQFRSEFFNAFNHPSFNQPGATLGTPSFGIISDANPGRIIQFALKYNF